MKLNILLVAVWLEEQLRTMVKHFPIVNIGNPVEPFVELRSSEILFPHP